MVDKKRKKGGLVKEKISVFTSMTEAVKELATSTRESKSLDIHADLYSTAMEQGGFSDEALMAALSHPLNNKARGVGFVDMTDAHRVLWLSS
ncbi:Acetyl-coenzyme A synthetase [Hordeum vulgare]|nr:Acetyl-coenzyme A synthetase [Hordeum vulgare]